MKTTNYRKPAFETFGTDEKANGNHRPARPGARTMEARRHLPVEFGRECEFCLAIVSTLTVVATLGPA